ncbi:YeeE/YedE family protein [Providencia rettgeri]|nr:YeeE/YedE family protein [Providencia rettgeri]EJD6642889.1 YeeE/YedE family protein [Providencia rettgeri]ELL9153992.1 YeeE/YedE family protein [Providencia rettgeri]ELR5048584.1 YeeE/YedE family protein [Providencia rettgeri]ELR5061487.1 YeeE/YedE family protein [Providencia rettgeri]
MPIIIALISGILFGLGLVIAGMGNPAKILSFLDITGNWDPSLLVTMAVAMVISGVSYVFIKRKRVSILSCPLQIPTNQIIDKKLITGSVLFGVGWGLAGICPGPALLLTGMGVIQGVIFTLAMIAGMAIFQFTQKN